jgi:predicted ATPase/DNA-binding winged helix-turn-helix (wHTH) protein
MNEAQPRCIDRWLQAEFMQPQSAPGLRLAKSELAEEQTGEVYSFERFRLLPQQRLLLEDDKPIHLSSRALELLIALVARAGEIVSKDELMAHAWPTTVVEEGNLRVHIAALRRALGDGRDGTRYLLNTPGRGYSFVAPLSVSLTSPASVTPLQAAPNLPAPLARMIGRSDVINRIATLLSQRRFISIVGPGGIGKTTVALAVGKAIAGRFWDSVRFIDLARLKEPGHVASALATELGLSVMSDEPLPSVPAHLRDRHMLLLLDNCEHVIDAAAALAEWVFRNASNVHILTTSREPLRATGEYVLRLPPLETPLPKTDLTAADAFTYPAVQLFVERASECVEGFELSDDNAAPIAEICRRLDGIALAIELAAGRTNAFGVRELAARLDDRFRLLTTGRRTALPHHQTLRAMLDWSYQYLPAAEQVALRRLAIFPGNFTLDAVQAVLADKVPAADVVDRIAGLVAKSLVAADAGEDTVTYRLLETTRAYAMEKLNQSGEFEEFARRHAKYYCGLCERSDDLAAGQPSMHIVDKIEDVSGALTWPHSTSGQERFGVAPGRLPGPRLRCGRSATAA